MKSISGCAVLFNLGLLAACGGVSNIGSGDPSVSAGGAKTLMGGASVGGSAAIGTEPKAGRGNVEPVGGRGNVEPVGMGGTSTGTGTITPMAGHGSVATGGHAGTPSEVAECAADDDCPFDSRTCIGCQDGSMQCGRAVCEMGVCRSVKPVCPAVDTCMGLACGTACKLCNSDGTCQPGESFCDAGGKCVNGMPQCNSNVCMTNADCGEPPPMCTQCADGSCATFDCLNGMCRMNCPAVVVACKYSEECMTPGTGCGMCPSGKCAVPACIQSTCQLVCPLQ